MKLLNISMMSEDFPNIDFDFKQKDIVESKNLAEYNAWVVITALLNNILTKDPYEILPRYTRISIRFEMDILGEIEEYLMEIKKEEEYDDVEENLYKITKDSVIKVKPEDDYATGFTSMNRSIIYRFSNIRGLIRNPDSHLTLINNRISSLLSSIYNNYDPNIANYIKNFLNELYSYKYDDYDFVIEKSAGTCNVKMKSPNRMPLSIFTMSPQERCEIYTLLYLLENYFSNKMSIVLFTDDEDPVVMRIFNKLKTEFLTKNKIAQVVFIQ